MKSTAESKTTLLELSFLLDPVAVVKRIRFRGDGQRAEETVERLVKAVTSVARPKALYRTCKVTHNDGHTIDIDGNKINSRVLSKVTADQDNVFPYIVTIGPELAAFSFPDADMLERYWLDNIKDMVLHSAGQQFADHLQKNYPTRRLTHMNPGEIDDWPITQQRPLFAMFGEMPAQNGITLTDKCMINPVKSRSGIYFANDTGFETCRLCHQLKCPGRRAAYDAKIAAEFTGHAVL
jgi:hypothetical protein